MWFSLRVSKAFKEMMKMFNVVLFTLDNITLIFRLLLLQSSEGPESEGEEISSEDSDNDEVSETRQIISLLIRE